jgi:hypothetical protein
MILRDKLPVPPDKAGAGPFLEATGISDILEYFEDNGDSQPDHHDFPIILQHS